MKYLSVFIFVLALALSSCNLNPTPERATAFNDSIVFALDTLYQDLELLLASFEQDEPELSTTEIRKSHNKTLQTALKYHSWLKQRVAFDDEDDFRLASIDLFNSYVQLLKDEFEKVIEIIEKPHEDIVLNDQVLFDSLLNVIILKDSIATYTFLEQQKAFAEKYNFTLQEFE